MVNRHPDLLFAAFNQDFSCLSIGTRSGYQILNCDPYGRVHSKPDGPTGIVEMLFCTSLVALVGAPGADGASGSGPGRSAGRESPRRLMIVNTKRQSTICELLFPTSVLAVKLNRKRMVVVLEEEIYIYNVSTMKLLHTIETSPNPEAICALSPSSENSIIAYPAPLPPPSTSASPSPSSSHPQAQPGDVVLFDTLSLSTINVIQAHKAPLAHLALNAQGTLLATASETGTVIRVWKVPGAEKVAQFRRGTYPAKVCSINFNLASTLLAVASDSDTIHIYKLPSSSNGATPTSDFLANGGAPSAFGLPDPSSPGSISSMSSVQPQASPSGPANSGSGSLRKKTFGLAGSYVGSYLPTGVRDMWNPERDFAHVKLRTGGVRCVVALSPSSPQVFVIAETGLFHAYSLDLERGGECVLMKEFSLITNDDPAVAEI